MRTKTWDKKRRMWLKNWCHNQIRNMESFHLEIPLVNCGLYHMASLLVEHGCFFDRNSSRNRYHNPSSISSLESQGRLQRRGTWRNQWIGCGEIWTGNPPIFPKIFPHFSHSWGFPANVSTGCPPSQALPLVWSRARFLILLSSIFVDAVSIIFCIFRWLHGFNHHGFSGLNIHFHLS